MSHFDSFLFLGSVLLSATLSQGNECQLRVFEEGSRDLIEGICVEEFKSDDCRLFVKSFEKSDLPPNFSLEASDYSVEKPKSTDLTSKLSPHSSNLYPGVYIDWSSPVSKQAKANIKGYLMIWEWSNATNCRLFKFNTTNQDMLLRELNFRFEVKYLRPKTHYQVRVYSMPPPEDLATSRDGHSFVSMNMTSGSSIKNYNDPGSWTPSLSAKVISDGTIEVKVGRSPEQFNLTMFEVMLLQRSVSELNFSDKKTINSSLSFDSQNPVNVLHFTGLMTDEYKIVVHVLDPFWKQDGKCLCWVMETHGKHCRLSCGAIATDWFHVGGVAETDNMKTTGAPTSPPDMQSTFTNRVVAIPSVETRKNGLNSKEEALVIGLGVVVALMIGIGAAAFFVMHTKKRKVPFPPSPVESPPGLPVLSKTQSVFILFAEDSPAHINYVMKFAKFLEEKERGDIQEWHRN